MIRESKRLVAWPFQRHHFRVTADVENEGEQERKIVAERSGINSV